MPDRSTEIQEVGDDLLVTPPGEEPPPFDFAAFLKAQAEKARERQRRDAAAE